MRNSPVGIATALCLALCVFALLTFEATRGGDHQAPGATRPAQPGAVASGETLACPGGGQVETSYNLIGGEFRLVGRLASVDGGRLLVKGPERYITVNLADGAHLDGSLQGGLLVRASGQLDAAGNALANSVGPACGSAAVVAEVTPVVTPFPQPSPAPGAPVVTPPATPRATTVATTRATVAPSHTTKPTKDLPPRAAAGQVTPRPTRTPVPARR